MKNPTIQLAVTTMLNAIAFIICIVVSGAFLPFLFVALGAMLSSKVSFDDAIASPLFIVFVIVGMAISFFYLLSKIEQQTIREKQERLSQSLR